MKFFRQIKKKIKIRFVFNTFFSPKGCPVLNHTEKCSRAGEAMDDNIGHAHFALGT
jgi:hypothetical protein